MDAFGLVLLAILALLLATTLAALTRLINAILLSSLSLRIILLQSIQFIPRYRITPPHPAVAIITLTATVAFLTLLACGTPTRSPTANPRNNAISPTAR